MREPPPERKGARNAARESASIQNPDRLRPRPPLGTSARLMRSGFGCGRSDRHALVWKSNLKTGRVAPLDSVNTGAPDPRRSNDVARKVRDPLDQSDVGQFTTDLGDGLPADGFASTEDFLSDGTHPLCCCVGDCNNVRAAGLSVPHQTLVLPNIRHWRASLVWRRGARGVEERKLVGAAPVGQRRIGLSRRRPAESMGVESRRHPFRRAKDSLWETWRSTKFPGERSEILAEDRIGATRDDRQRQGETASRQVAVNSARRRASREPGMSALAVMTYRRPIGGCSGAVEP